MRKFTQLIESLNSAVEWLRLGNTYHFTINRNQYHANINVIRGYQNAKWLINKVESEGGDGSDIAYSSFCEFTFDEGGRIGTTGRGNAAAVISTIVEIFEDVYNNVESDVIYFSGTGRSRVKLYNALARIAVMTLSCDLYENGNETQKTYYLIKR